MDDPFVRFSSFDVKIWSWRKSEFYNSIESSFRINYLQEIHLWKCDLRVQKAGSFCFQNSFTLFLERHTFLLLLFLKLFIKLTTGIWHLTLVAIRQYSEQWMQMSNLLKLLLFEKIVFKCLQTSRFLWQYVSKKTSWVEGEDLIRLNQI